MNSLALLSKSLRNVIFVTSTFSLRSSRYSVALSIAINLAPIVGLLAVSKPSDSIRVWVQVLLLELYRVLMVVIVAVQSILNSHLSSVLRIRIATTLGRMMHMASKDLKRRADTLI